MTAGTVCYTGGHFHWLAGGSSISGSHGLHCSIARASASSRSPWIISSSTCPQLIISSIFSTFGSLLTTFSRSSTSIWNNCKYPDDQFCMCSAFWCWLSCQHLPSDWLERLFWGRLIMVKIISAKPRPKTAYDYFSFGFCFTVLLCLTSPPALYFNIYSYGTI